MDDTPWYLESIREKGLWADDLSACNHMAIDLRWCMGHDLMSVEFMDTKESICKSYGNWRCFLMLKRWQRY